METKTASPGFSGVGLETGNDNSARKQLLMVAFSGMLLLARQLKASPLLSLIAASTFGFSISYTVYGLSIAAIPVVIYLTQRAAEGSARAWHMAALLLLGWNSALVMAGAFLVVTLPFIRNALFGPSRHSLIVRAYLPYALGLLLGSAGLVYATLTGLRLDRSEWLFSGTSWLVLLC